MKTSRYHKWGAFHEARLARTSRRLAWIPWYGRCGYPQLIHNGRKP